MRNAGMDLQLAETEWLGPANVHSTVTSCLGGSSKAPFSGLNLATHVGDQAASVASNREAVISSLKLGKQPVWLDQVHGNRVHLEDGSTAGQNSIQADASYTNQPGITLAILVADCIPLFLCSSDGLEIAAVHAGWRGLANGVIERAVGQFQSDHLLAWLGPAIGPCHYEVDKIVRNSFSSDRVFSGARNSAHWMFDLKLEATRQLHLLGINDVQRDNRCTYCCHELYSYRRDGTTGRFAGLIWRDD